MEPLNELALFAGAGGGILGAKLLGQRTVCAVEIEPYCREILLRRQEEGYLQPFPIWDDVRTLDGYAWRGKVDVVSAGFPCQPFSVAGKRRGENDERNMWPDTIRIIREVGPKYALLENVPGLVRYDYFGTILGDLADAGYDAEWDVISAAECGAPHLRKRLWIVAHATKDVADSRLPRNQWRSCVTRSTKGAGASSETEGCSNALANPDNEGPQGHGGLCECPCKLTPWACSRAVEDARLIESGICRISHGVANRTHRLKALGNGQVPAVVARAWRLLSK